MTQMSSLSLSGEQNRKKEFLEVHGNSALANNLQCSVGLASILIIVEEPINFYLFIYIQIYFNNIINNKI